MTGFGIGLLMLVFAGCSSKSPGQREAGVADAAMGSDARAPDAAASPPADSRPGTPEVWLKDAAEAADSRHADRPVASDLDPLPSDSGAASSDAPAVPDARKDSGPATDAAPPSPDLGKNPPDLAPLSCASFRAMVDKLMLANQHVRRMLFTRDGRSMLLQVYSAGTGSDDVVLVDLQSGEQRIIARTVADAEWLGPTGLLLTMADASLQAISLDGEIRRTIAGKTCGHAVPPDGARIIYTHDCDRAWGTASVLDVASGTTERLDTAVSMNSKVVVSPGGRWAAYVVSTGPADAATPNTAVRVVEKGSAPYTVTMTNSARDPVFLAEDALLIRTAPYDADSTSIWGHRPGTTEVKPLAQGDYGLAGPQINADRSGFAVASFAGSASRAGALVFVSFADGGVSRLATDLMDYRISAAGIQGFVMAAASQRLVYVATTATDAGLLDSIASVALDGKGPTQLVPRSARAVVSPYGDRVFACTSDAKSTAYPGAVISGSTGATQFKVEDATSANSVTFVPNDRGLLWVTRETSSVPWRLRYLSFAKGTVTTIGEWNSSPLQTYTGSMGIEPNPYPVDPSGCFVPVDSDIAPAGTRLALLPD